MSVSLKDIAAELGLSKTTVSWVLSGKGDQRNISPDTQQRVLDCASRLNYVPNSLARSLNFGYSKTIGLIVPSISDSFYANIANKIEEVAHASGYSLMIASSNSDARMEEELIRVFVEKQVDGIILASMKLTRSGVEYLQTKHVPLVMIDRYYPDMADVSYVIIDNYEASYALVSRMLSEGYGKIAIVTTNPHLTTMDQRRKGYEKALEDGGIQVDSRLNITVPVYDYIGSLPASLETMFSEVPDVDGFFFTTHILLEEALKYFLSRDINVRDGHFAFSCMRSDPLMRLVVPDLRVAEFPENEMGQVAVDILVDEIEAKLHHSSLPVRSVVLRCKIC